jgi:cytochrome P450
MTITTTPSDLTLDEAGRIFSTPRAYGDEHRWHEAAALLRRESPVHLVGENDFCYPFYAITKHADVLEIEGRNDIFINAPRPVLGEKEADDRRVRDGDMLRTLIHMDEPDHKAYRAMTGTWFQPSSLRKLEARMAELARRYVDQMMTLGSECDFMRDVAVHYPLYVILSILGLPESDHPRMLTLTQELFGAADEELQRGSSIDDVMAVVADYFRYFGELTAARRAQPTDDLASVIANATLDGDLLGEMETISYYVIIATAGHDTTSSTIGGGLDALLDHPDQLDRLRADHSLLSSAVDEMIRWVSPVKHFMRTATEDYTIRGTTIRAGESVLLSYASANRDEEVFTDSLHFDVGRSPNRHLAFGFGVHYCLGALLARMEVKALYAELLPRLRHIERTAPTSYMSTLFVGGPKRLPIRYALAPAE